MSENRFDSFFTLATGLQRPFDYQCRLACGEQNGRPESDWLAGGTPCQSRLINIPTGLGKTAAVVLAWLWNRVAHPDKKHRQSWPRRLVYCLPMRTLVEQTEKNVWVWLDRLRKEKLIAEMGAHVLMGGEENTDWDIYPERDAILIGTQDMLLSRALNRGYAAGRARWPKDFALLNNDCLWVFDEVQLMSTGFATSLQLQAWRERGAMESALPTFSWWMSATVEEAWFRTAVDFIPCIRKLCVLSRRESRRLWVYDPKRDSESAKRIKDLLMPGRKKFHFSDAPKLKAEKPSAYLDAVAKAVNAKRREFPDKTILVIVNTVQRACDLAGKLKAEDPLLLHSRFRPHERRAWVQRLKTEELIVATQVVEAGVDISSRVLFTELCPWPSFVQRCGRAARKSGEEADIYWLDVGKETVPYSEDEMLAAMEQLEKLSDASLAGLRAHQSSLNPEEVSRLLPYSPRFVPQSKDLLEFFDTTPDLTGADVDVARYIRDGEEHDVSAFWRDCYGLARENPPKKWQPEHEELCPVLVPSFKEFVQAKPDRIWRWDYHDGWVPLQPGDPERIYAGQVFLLDANCGGYRTDVGWTGNPEDRPWDERPSEQLLGPWKTTDKRKQKPSSSPAQVEDDAPELESSDAEEEDGENLVAADWQSIAEHSHVVLSCLNELLRPNALGGAVPDNVFNVLRLAARLHDWGKAHNAFRAKLKPEARKEWERVRDGRDFPAKAPGKNDEKQRPSAWKPNVAAERLRAADANDEVKRRPGFRHELASALAVLELLHRARPTHAAIIWPEDEELRTAFGMRSPPEPEPLPPEVQSLVEELGALSRDEFDLLIYVVAAHHGKVRMSLRSAPDDLRDDVPDPPGEKRQARGVRDGDSLPRVRLPSANDAEISVPGLTLHLDPMELGLTKRYGRSWRERAESLLTKWRPFQLAWFETLLRVADNRASQRGLSEAQLESAARVSPNMELREESLPHAATPPLSPAEQSLVADLVADGLSIQEKFRPEPLYKQTGKGHYESGTVEEMQKAKNKSRENQKS